MVPPFPDKSGFASRVGGGLALVVGGCHAHLCMNLIGIIVLAVLSLAGFTVVCIFKQRLVRLTGLASVVVALAIAGFFLWQLHRWNSGFDKIHIGESREQIRQIMGVPTEATD